MEKALHEISSHLENGIIPFWLQNGIDNKHGGYLTNFDEDGKPTGGTDKYIVTQTRMIWGLSAFYRAYPENKVLMKDAKQGVDFFIRHFWDKQDGGWYWKTKQDGTLIDDGKVVYGQSFAIYALAEYTLATGDPIGLKYAEQTFDLLQKYCADTYHGGYYENLEKDWNPSEPGFAAGDRKSLDIHMHLMEAFTTLAQCSNKQIHRRKLAEVIAVIKHHMIDMEKGCALNQFDLAFNPIPAINIRRTWNAERGAGETIDQPMDTTSYGHNVELSWLLNRAGEVLNKPFDYYNDITKKLVDHSLNYGFDHELGGVFRDGPHNGPALVNDKEWWQNSEVLVGYLDAYEKLGDEKYFDAFLKTWNFDNKYMINHDVGEWRQLLKKDGEVIIANIGNPWKALYHSGRSMLECIQRIQRLIQQLN
ncbi:MAG: N-acylglucosamine 2-epimerase [Firmicutes bacterium]|nr:N-acylglucosamine 2-epimerase [Bacillota bacterium]